MSIQKVENIDLIIWKKQNDDYICHINNCGVNKNTKLKKFLKKNKIDYYNHLLNTKEPYTIKQNHHVIFIQYIDEDTISEIRVPKSECMYLLSCISHKIRNPLTNVVGALSLFEDTKMDKQQKKYMSMLKKSSYDIIGIANDIIDIINLYNGEIKLTYDKNNVNKLSSECKDMITTLINEKKLYLHINIDDIPDLILIDKSRLIQIVMSLLINAVQNTYIGGITLEVTNFNSDDHRQSNCPFTYIEAHKPTSNILFKIRDTGTGIKSENLDFINKILGINNTKSMPSTSYIGFGLLIAKHLCNLMGGNIWFSTHKDIGTIFYFNIICEGITFA